MKKYIYSYLKKGSSSIYSDLSGLPRSGTSLMMNMLAAGGLEVLTDHLRVPMMTIRLAILGWGG
jgi:hypothetical protein